MNRALKLVLIIILVVTTLAGGYYLLFIKQGLLAIKIDRPSVSVQTPSNIGTFGSESFSTPEVSASNHNPLSNIYVNPFSN